MTPRPRGIRGMQSTHVILDEAHLMTRAVGWNYDPSPYPPSRPPAGPLRRVNCQHRVRETQYLPELAQTVRRCLDCGDELYRISDRMLEMVANFVPWSNPASDPIADLHAAYDAAMAAASPRYQVPEPMSLSDFVLSLGGQVPSSGLESELRGTYGLGGPSEVTDTGELVHGPLEAPAEDDSWEHGATAYRACLDHIDDILR